MKILHNDVTDAELDVLEVLWDGPATIRQIADRLYPGGRTSHYATVQKLLERLERKSCVSRQPDGRVYVYSATVSRRALVLHRLRDTADRLCGGSLAPLLTHLVDGRQLSADEIGELRRMVDRLDTEDEP